MTDENEGKNGHQDDLLPPSGSQGSGNAKWIAIIIVLIVVIAGLAVAYAIKPTAVSTSGVASPTATVNQLSGSTFNFAIKGSNMQSVYANFGDLAPGVVNFTASPNQTILSHTYADSGSYLVYLSGTTTSGASLGNNLIPIGASVVEPISASQSNGLINIVDKYSSSQSTTPQVFTGSNANVALFFGYYTEPANTSYSVFAQSYSVYNQGVKVVNSTSLNYVFNASLCSYAISNANATVNLTNMPQGYYTVQLITSTGMVNSTTGKVSNATSTTAYFDFAIYASGNYKIATAVSASGTFTNAELETGGFRTLDPALAYDTVSDEILSNTYQTLTTYQGSNSSAYAPYLAATLPNLTNGGVNTNYHNYTQTVNSAVAGYSAPSYAVNITPGENYTFHINPKAEFQNGTAVTAWDVMYSLTRDLLFTANAFNPGWIIAQYMLPGNYYASNTFWNITQNMTVDNATNSITIHFQHPMPEALVYQIFFASGTYITSATWLQQQGSGITWTAAGFHQYIKQGYPQNYNTKVEFNVDANGPYELFSVSQNSQVVLKVNPHFSSPNKWVPAPTIKFVDIKYIAEPSTTYLLLSSGQAQAAGIPTSSWNEVQSLEKSNTVYALGSSSLNINWYNFNTNVNVTLTQQTVANANMPRNLFASLHARRAFSYAYNETNYLNNDVGNAKFNTTFASAFAGMLPQGMLGYQSIPQLNNLTQGVPYFNLAIAKADWNYVMVHDGAKLGLSMSNGNVMYNGKTLVIPIYIYSADPVDLGGATTWGADLKQVIPGASFPVEPTAFPTLIGNGVYGDNPMPIWELGWAPDYPFPTDYLGPMGLPVSTATYPGPNDMTVGYFENNTTNQLHGTTTAISQANNLTKMKAWYYAGAVATSTTVALEYFHKMNEMLVNMTFYYDLLQAHEFVVLSSKINEQQASVYQLNTMWVGVYLMYYDLTYNPS